MPSREHHRGRRGQRGRPGDQARPNCSRRGASQLLGRRGRGLFVPFGQTALHCLFDLRFRRFGSKYWRFKPHFNISNQYFKPQTKRLKFQTKRLKF